MNKLTTELISEILTQDAAWTKPTKAEPVRKLRRNYVVDTYHDWRESLFYDELFFPRMMRAYRMIKAWGIFPDAEWDEVDMGYNAETHGTWPRDPDLADYIGNHFSGEVIFTNTGKARETYFSKIWNGPDWAWEDPTEEEILTLEVKPRLVTDKVDKRGNVQVSMF